MPTDALTGTGWRTAAEVRARMDQWRATTRPELATAADLRKARLRCCPLCRKPATGVLVLDRGSGWQPWRLAVCPACEVYGDLTAL